MPANVRRQIVDLCLGQGRVPTSQEIASLLGLSEKEIGQRLQREPALTDLHSLTPEMALTISQRFNGVAFFSSAIQKALTDFSATRKKLKTIERQHGE